MSSKRLTVSPEQVNRIFRSMLPAVWVDVDAKQVVAYTPRDWCVSMFPPDKVRAIKGSPAKRLPGDQLFGGVERDQRRYDKDSGE